MIDYGNNNDYTTTMLSVNIDYRYGCIDNRNMYYNYWPTPPICNVPLLTEAVVSICDDDDEYDEWWWWYDDDDDDDDDDDEYDDDMMMMNDNDGNKWWWWWWKKNTCYITSIIANHRLYWSLSLSS